MTLIKFPSKVNNSSDLVSPFSNSVFESLFNDSFFTDRLISRVPAVNIVESERDFSIELAAPGLEKSDFEINVDKNIVTISAEVSEQKESKEKVFTKREYSFKSFSRSFTLPDVVDYSNIEATYENGVLTVKIGKKEEAIIAKRLIEVK